MKRLVLASTLGAAALAVTLALVSLGGAVRQAQAAPAAATTVEVTIHDNSLTAVPSSAPAGDVQFVVSNAGTHNHEFLVIKTDLAPDALPVVGDTVDENASSLQVIDEIAPFAAGTQQTLTVNLAAGNYVLICNLPGHYQGGVHTAFTVTEATATATPTATTPTTPAATATPAPTATPAATATPTPAATATPTPAATAAPTPAATATTTPTPTPGATTVQVNLKEFSITPSLSSVPAGAVTFVASNTGTMEHEMVILKTDLAPDALPVVDNQATEDGPGVQHIDEIEEFEPGTQQTLTVNLTPGNYVLICNVPGHYQSGMRTAFTVTGAGATPTPAAPPPSGSGSIGSDNGLPTAAWAGIAGAAALLALAAAGLVFARQRSTDA